MKCKVIVGLGYCAAGGKCMGVAVVITLWETIVKGLNCTHMLTYYLHTYLLTPRSAVLLQKLNGSQLVKKFPTFYGTRKFITAFTSARHLSLS